MLEPSSLVLFEVNDESIIVFSNIYQYGISYKLNELHFPYTHNQAQKDNDETKNQVKTLS